MGPARVLTQAQGLPAMDVSTLAAVPNTNGTRVWVGTSGGAARVGLEADTLHLERAVTSQDNLPTGPVNALTALADGGAFLAFNALDAKFIFDANLAQRRARAQVRYVPATGPPGDPIPLLQGQDPLSPVDIRALVVTGSGNAETLWAATSAGLLKGLRPREPGAGLVLVAEASSVQVPIRVLMAHPEDGTLWMLTEPVQDVPARLIGYRPESHQTLILGAEHGMPSGVPLHDLAFTKQGELVLLAGAHLFKGRISLPGKGLLTQLNLFLALLMVLTLGTLGWRVVFRDPLVLQYRAQPAALRELPLTQIALVLSRLRRAFALQEVRERLGLAPDRLQLLSTLATTAAPGDAALRAVAALLGMPDAAQAAVQTLCQGVCLLMVQLSYPEPLRGHALPLIGLDPTASRGLDPVAVRDAIRQALRHQGHSDKLPVLVLCWEAEAGRPFVPDEWETLVLTEAMLRNLLFASSPQQTFAGLLLTNGLLALSPYRPSGRSKTSEHVLWAEPPAPRTSHCPGAPLSADWATPHWENVTPATS